MLCKGNYHVFAIFCAFVRMLSQRDFFSFESPYTFPLVSLSRIQVNLFVFFNFFGIHCHQKNPAIVIMKFVYVYVLCAV